MAQWVKDPALPLLWHRSQLRFDPWLRNFHTLQVQPKKKKKEEEEVAFKRYIVYGSKKYLLLIKCKFSLSLS